MLKSLVIAAAALALGGLAQAAGPLSDPAIGDWMTPGGSAKVRIAACPANPSQLCGDIVWLKQGLDATGKPVRDHANPDPALRARPLVGAPFITGFTRQAPGRWGDGRIYDPDSGKTYRSKMHIDNDGTLKLEGCVLVFCQAQTWTRSAS
ncbi:MAG: DUF2147 domain-containing protein [Phenylobacterium sp.]|nr:MAG: DUF2147 domain-containing protein [Phenylobacterium sp.]